MNSFENAFSDLKPREGENPGEKKFEGGKSLHETIKTPWLDKRPVQEEIEALKTLSKSFNIILGNPP